MTKCATGLLVFACAIGLFAACGGSAIDGGGASGAGQSAGSSSAGASNGTAGAVSHGGASSAGAASFAGNSSGGGATAGAPATGGCSLPSESGMCDGYMPSFWHNPKNGLCEPFIYGGCGGNANRFATRDACLAACPGGGENWGACAVDSDCAWTNTDCCGCEPSDDRSLVALNGKFDMNWGNQHCANVGICAPCPEPGETQQVSKYFKPVCVSGQCSILDIRESKLSACNTAADCMLRNGANCCTECDQSGWVSVNKQADFCGGNPQPCPSCASFPPPKSLVPTCEQGVCRLALLLK